jgi:hypothetical protein
MLPTTVWLQRSPSDVILQGHIFGRGLIADTCIFPHLFYYIFLIIIVKAFASTYPVRSFIISIKYYEALPLLQHFPCFPSKRQQTYHSI